MGVAITDLLPKKEVDMDFFKGKTLAVDSSMWLYQFLTSIRQRDGQLLTNSRGEPTSHLVGLFSRICNLLKNDIKLIFVFDGEPPELKKQTLQQRRNIKEQALKQLVQAEKDQDQESMRRYASMTSRLTKEMKEEAKELVLGFGLPVISAPSEAEAQGSKIVENKDAFALATNDADALLFGAPLIVRNLNMAGRRKRTSKLAYDTIKPDTISLSDTLNGLGIDQEQLITLSMLVGTDYNPGGIKGIGPKNALKLVKKQQGNLQALFEEVKWSDFFTFDWKEVFYQIKHTPTEDYSLEWGEIDKQRIAKLLVDKHEFSSQRFDSQLDPLLKNKAKKAQKGLTEFFP